MTDREQHVINYLNSLPRDDRFVDLDLEEEQYGIITRDRPRTSVHRRGYFCVQGNPMKVYYGCHFNFEQDGYLYDVEYCSERNISYGSITKLTLK